MAGGRAFAFLLYAAFIGYQSLAAGGPWACDGAVLEMPRRIPRADLLVNIVAYVPLGALCLIAAWPRRRNAGAAVVAIGGSLLAVSLYSLTLELVQACEAWRVSSAVDWLANSAGAAIGVGLTALVLVRHLPAGLPPLTLDDPRLRTCTIAVVLLWIGGETMPWVYSLDVSQARGNLRFLAQASPFSALDPWRVARHAGAWLAVAASCRLATRGRVSGLALLAGAALLSVGLQVLVFARVPLSYAELLGMAMAIVPAAVFMLGRRDWRLPAASPVALLAGIVVVLLAYELHPGSGSVPQAFGWWPRVGFGRPLDALEFAWLFGWAGLATVVAAEWAGRASPLGRPRQWPAGIVALVLVLELAQVFVPGRSGDTSAVLFTGLAVMATRAVLRTGDWLAVGR